MRAPLALVESDSAGTSRRLCAIARDRGLHPVMLVSAPARYPWLVADGVETHHVDTSDLQTVLSVCRKLGPLAGVTSSSEHSIGTAAAAARALGLPGPDPSAITLTSDTLTQRQALSRAGVPVPRFVPVNSAEQAGEAALRIGGPVVVKPTSESDPVDVRLCDTPAEATERAASLLPDRGTVLVEEYVSGPGFSVESIGDVVVATVADHLGPPPDFVPIGHDCPAATEDETLAGVSRRARAALGLDWGPTRIRLRLTPGGPVVTEVAPKPAAGMTRVIVQAATGVDLVEAALDAVCGYPDRFPVPAPTLSPVSIRFLVPGRSGVVSALKGLANAQAVPGVVDAAFTITPGRAFERRHSSSDRLGYVITVGDDAPARAEVAIAKMRVEFEARP